MKLPQQLLPSFSCIHCGRLLGIQSPDLTQLYFKGIGIPCPHCRETLDLWDLMVRSIRENTWAQEVFALIGAQATLTSIKLYPDRSTQLKLAEMGIPEDAKVLDINYTSQDDGGLGAVESHGNNPHRFKHEIRHDILLHPVPFRYGDPTRETTVSVLITWVPHTTNDEAWENLVSASRAFYSRQYQSAVIPANVAVEARLSRLLTSFLDRFVSKKRSERFLEEAATYSYQLNVLLPVFAALRGVPQLPDRMRGYLNTLRSYRNDIAHKGTTEKVLEQDDMANCLCAALFGFHYLNLIESDLLGPASNEPS